MNLLTVKDEKEREYYFDSPYRIDEFVVEIRILKEYAEDEIRRKIEPVILHVVYCLQWIKMNIKPINEKTYNEEWEKLEQIKLELMRMYSNGNPDGLVDFVEVCPWVVKESILEEIRNK